MNELENLDKLYSLDRKIIYEGIKEKSSWILHKFYYIASLSDNKDVEDIIEGRLRFKQLYIDANLFLDNKQKYEEAFSKFNENFRVLYLDNNEPLSVDKDEFAVEINFNKLTNDAYKKLFANFYHCFDYQDLKINSLLDTKELIKCALSNINGNNVVILDKDNLYENTFSSRVVSKIIVYPNLSSGYLPSLKKMCEDLSIEMVEKND